MYARLAGALARPAFSRLDRTTLSRHAGALARHDRPTLSRHAGALARHDRQTLSWHAGALARHDPLTLSQHAIAEIANTKTLKMIYNFRFDGRSEHRRPGQGGGAEVVHQLRRGRQHLP
jgi:hypothetical protein